MIRKTWSTDKWLLTSQLEHARLSAIIAAAWKFPGKKVDDEVKTAIRAHDNGWAEADENPMVKSNGDPRGFHEVQPSQGIPIYTKSIELCEAEGHFYAAALIAGHFVSLVEHADLAVASTRDAIAAGQFIARQRDNIQRLKGEVEQQENGAEKLKSYDDDLRFLQVCDYLSLLVCTDFNDDDVIENVPYLENGDTLRVRRSGNLLTLTIDPLPFKTNLRDHLTSWVVPYMPYESSEELKNAMEEVKTVTNEVHIGAKK